MADSLVDTFENRIDRAYSGWETNKTTDQDIEELILEVVALEYDRADLIDDPFVDAIRDYLINNYA
jgi:type I restriction enzyme R subunit